MVDVFISYTRDDANIAALFAKTLSAEGYDVWWDQRIPTGMTWREYIPEKIASAKSVVVLWSSKSSGSDWVKEEAGLARDDKKLLPVLVDDSPVPFGFKEYECAQLAGWSGQRTDPEWLQLLEGVERLSKMKIPSILDKQKNHSSVVERTKKMKAMRRTRKTLLGFVSLVGFLIVLGIGFSLGKGGTDANPTSAFLSFTNLFQGGSSEQVQSAKEEVRVALKIRTEVDSAVIKAEEAATLASRGEPNYQVLARTSSTWRGEALRPGIVSGVIEFTNGNSAVGEFRYDGRIFFGERYIDRTLRVSTFYGKDARVRGQPRYSVGVLQAENGTVLVGKWDAEALKFVGKKIPPSGEEVFGSFVYKQNSPSNVAPE
jgi:hypothetical protein